MTEVVRPKFGHHVPDILDCLAQLSNDEVPTPPKVARDMLKLLPAEVWTNPDYKWLDPFSKSGVYLREVAARLLDGLAAWEPDFDKRREHIFRNMLYGCSITTMTGIIARRSLYCARDASSDLSVVKFANPDGNLPFIPAEHHFVRGRCTKCGGPETLEREGRENHAYAFIHDAYPTKEMRTMKWDIVVGNPPFQVSDGGGGGGASSTPLYNLFVEHAIALNPRHVVMITPSRWFSGGKGLDEFRDKMLKDKRFVALVDHPQLYDCFPGVKIRGGVSYWHWDREHNGPCAVSTKVGDQLLGPPVSRYLDAYDVLIRRNAAVTILDKVAGYRVNGAAEPSLGGQVSARKPFGLTNERGIPSPDGLSDPVLLYGNQIQTYLERSAIPANKDWIDDWKVLLVKAHGTSGREDLTILGEPVLAAPGSACTETYLVIGRTQSESEARHLAAYMRTRFVRFLVSLRKITQNITRDSYRFVPRLPMDRDWADDDLYARYNLTESDINFIEANIRERPSDEEMPDVADEPDLEDEE